MAPQCQCDKVFHPSPCTFASGILSPRLIQDVIFVWLTFDIDGNTFFLKGALCATQSVVDAAAGLVA